MKLKPAKTLSEQVLILKERGCVINDDSACMEFLSKVNYYRLSAYFLPFRTGGNAYKNGTTLERIKGIYDFDQNIRTIIFSAVEELEIYVRAKLAYYHAHAYGAHGYWDSAHYNNRHQHSKFINQLESEIDRNKKVLFVKHHLSKYDGKFPIWVAVELFSFGMLSHFFTDLPLKDRKSIAQEFNTKEMYLSSWLRAMTVLRNTCAHYGRLYYWNFTNIPRIPTHIGQRPTGRLFDQLLTLKLISPDPTRWNDVYISRLSELVDEYMNFIDLDHIGFPLNWKNVLMQTKL